MTKDKWPSKQMAAGEVRRGAKGCGEYSIFLFNYARCFLSAKTFDMESKTKNLSQMMGSTCEAFAVIDYANNYVTWRNECRQEMGDEVLDITDGSTTSIRPYSGTNGGQGKYKGWSGEGLELLYHKIVELLEEQRKSDRHGAMFEGELKKKWKDQGGARKRQRSDDDDGEQRGHQTI